MIINASKKTVILCGPSLSAVSGVSTHLNQLLGSSLAEEFKLLHFQVGSEGRGEGKIGKIWRLFTSPVSFLSYVITKKPDLVLLNTSLEPKSFWRDLVYLLIVKVLGISVVYQVHGGELPEKFLGTGKVAQWFTCFCLKLPDAVVLLAEVERKSYQLIEGIKLIVVIPNAIDVEEYSHIKPKLYENDSLLLGYIGRLAGDKGIKESLLALSLLQKSNNLSFKYLIVGSGPAEEELKKLSSDLNLMSDVSFLPPVFGAEKVKFWGEIDVFLFPTYHREGLPYTILESLASRTPVITSLIGGIPDVITDNVQGVFVDPYDINELADAINRLLLDREKLRVMSSLAVARAHEYYTISRLASQFTQLFNEVLDK